MRRSPILVTIFLALLATGPVEAGPITFLTALPVGRSQTVVRGQYLFIRATGDPTPADQDLTVSALPLAVAVGVTSKLALFGVVPVVRKSVDVDTPLGRRTLDATGLGDVVLFARYTVKAVDLTESTFRIAPFGGVKVPTGSDDTSGPLGTFPRPLQPGSGSWDGLGGIAVTWQTKQWELDADASYKKNTEADGYRFGDQASVDASFQYRVWPRRLSSGVPAFLYAVAETNLVSERRSEIADLRDSNSGGTRWDVDLGLQFVRESYILEGIVQIPTIDRPNGAGLLSDFRVTAGFRWNIWLPF